LNIQLFSHKLITTRLADLEILVLDCQATGNHPSNGHLLEMGWANAKGTDDTDIALFPITTYLVKLPGDIEIPNRIRRLTGISQDDMTTSFSPEKVWQELRTAARRIANAHHTAVCPTAIHYSRFEGPFLRQLHRRYDHKNVFPLDIICTHEIAKRLFPELPRRGLKAIAGFFGHSVPKLKRSASHVAATIIIWRNMCKLLEDLYGVHTLDELDRWLKNTTASFRSGRAYPMDPKIRLSLPDEPGIYRMLRHNGDLLYIGKARSLKQRVNSYFQKHSRHAEHILEMLSQARDLEVIPTPTALEASLLESDEIKRCSPPYNVVLRQESRNLWFCSRDFRQFAFTAAESFCIGPLPSREMFTAFSAIGDLATSGCDDTTDSERFDAPAVLCIPEQYAPPDDIFQQGFRIFCQRYDDVLKKKSVWRGLMTIGSQLWRKYLEEMTMAGSGRDSAVDHQILPEEKEKPEEKVWTPESVISSIESVIQRCAHWIRRSRWLCMISESSLAWELRNTKGGNKQVIVIKKGEITDRHVLGAGILPPLPPGYRTGYRARQRNFDLITYDRLRVMTTELRRLVSEGRLVELRLGRRPILRHKELVRALNWV
jgi:DNA polymerase-3 subunit epsilon